VAAPPAEIEITSELVGSLVRDQHQDLADLPLAYFNSGWDNALYRLGDDFLVRLPRRALGATLNEREVKALPRLAPHLPLPVPVPLRQGAPGRGYPWHWSITRFLTGEVPADGRLPEAAARQLAEFLRALHAVPLFPGEINRYRGGDLRELDAALRDRAEKLNAPAFVLDKVWPRALAAPFPGRIGWIHGDLHNRNLLLAGDELAAVLDWGDVTHGDPATDLAVFYLADDPASCFELYGADKPTRARAAGWAARFALTFREAGLGGDGLLGAASHRLLKALDD